MQIYSQYDNDFKDFIVKTSYTMPFEDISKIHSVPEYLIRYWRFGILLISDDIKTATKVVNKLSKPTNLFKWVIKYHTEFNYNSITSSTVYITDDTGKCITDDSNLHFESVGNTFSLIPSEPYKYDTFYYFYITDGIMFKNRSKVKPVTVRFMVVEEYEGKGIRFIKEVVDGYSLMQEIEPSREMEFCFEDKPENEINIPYKSKFEHAISICFSNLK